MPICGSPGRIREQIVRQLSEYEIETDVAGVVTTLGANQALDLIIRQCTQPGDHVMVEEPCYSDLLVALRLRDVKSIGIPMTSTGPDAGTIEAVSEKYHPKLYFTNSRLHNPTGASYSSSTAFKVLKAAERYNCLIVEDDVSAGLVQGSHFTLASMDQLKRVVYVWQLLENDRCWFARWFRCSSERNSGRSPVPEAGIRHVDSDSY